jgi:hypothetical protein
MNRSVKWFNHAVFVGALINILGMALPFIVAPQWYLDRLGLPGGGASVLWMRQAGLLLLCISILYVRGGRDPQRYRLNAMFAVFVRMVIGSYWFWLVYGAGQTRVFVVFGIVDWAYAVFTGILLWLVLRPQARTPRTSR